MRQFTRQLFGDIRFWIVLFFIIRLYGITNPPLEIAHSWRQVTGNMVARNFYETDNNLLFPRIDMAGEKTGITGTEFPLLNYLTYLLSLPFGFHDWLGRLINLLISSFGVFYFYKLLRLKFEEQVSFFAGLLLLCSNWFIYSRKVMPDTFSVSLIIIALYFCVKYFQSRHLIHLLLYALFAMIGTLSKIPAGFLLCVLIFPLAEKNTPIKVKLNVVIASVIVLIPVAWWYFYWVPFLVNEFGFWHYYMGTGLSNGIIELKANMKGTLEKFYFDALKFSGFALFISGIIITIIKKEKKLLLIFTLCLLSFFVFMSKAGHTFSVHSYYIIPFVPVMALLAAYAVSQVKNNWARIMIISIVTVESVANQQHDFRIKESEKYKLKLESIADKVCDRNTLIGTNGGDNPQQIYFTHRKGWTFKDEGLSDNRFLDSLREKGCEFIFINKVTLTNPAGISGTNVFEDDSFKVIRLKE